MAKSKTQKKDLVKFYADKLKESKAVYIIQSQGLSANESTGLKKDLYDLDSSYHIVKNTLFKLALKEAGLEESEAMSSGQHGVIFANETHLSSAAKKGKELLSEKDNLDIVAGYLDSKLLNKEEVKEIAELPTYEEMLAKFVGTLNAPVSGFVNVMAGNVRGFMNVLNAVKDQKAE